ncbi:MAG TPA: hypothetical protein DCS19_00590, partial [Flavobacterium sp.]|nr:hypothetical protein [Flavobacterium sp.]
PTSNFEIFRQHIMNPNKPFELSVQEGDIMKVQKNLVLSLASDSTGVGYVRNIIPMTYLNSVFGKTGRFNLLLSPTMIFQHDILLRSRSILFQRTMNPQQISSVQMYKDNKAKYGYKMVYDVDDFIWEGEDKGEAIPDYNFGKIGINKEVQQAALTIMNMMDTVCVSTKFLGDYIRSHGVDKPEIKVVNNVVGKYFWGPQRKKAIKSKLTKPRVIYTGSPTHWNQEKKLKGDVENAFCEFIIKNVMDNKIEYTQMGGLPFFFECIANKIKVIEWVNTYQYPQVIREARPDFSIGPLVPNYFNYSKSDLKAIESYAYGAVFIGSTWKGTEFEKNPSPYDDCPVNVPYNITVDDLDRQFWELTEVDNYNRVIKQQYDILDNTGRWLESEKYINMMTQIF